MLYRCCWFIARFFFRTCFRWEVIGAKRIPEKGPVMICSNHLSYIDPPLIGASVRRKVHFMAKEELFRIPVLSLMIRYFGAYPVKRGSTSRQPIRKSLDILREGNMIGVFPEGTRSKDGRLGKAYPGAAVIALHSDAAVVPVAIIGPYRPFRKLKVVYGQPLRMTDLRNDPTVRKQELTKNLKDHMMDEIHKLLKEHS